MEDCVVAVNLAAGLSDRVGGEPADPETTSPETRKTHQSLTSTARNPPGRLRGHTPL